MIKHLTVLNGGDKTPPREPRSRCSKLYHPTHTVIAVAGRPGGREYAVVERDSKSDSTGYFA